MQQTINIEQLVISKGSVEAERNDLLKNLIGFRKISDKEKGEFCTQLSVMLQSRVSLHRSLEVLILQARNEGLKNVIEKLLRDIQKGSSFSKALARHPEVFDELFVVTAEVGQETGRLGETLANLAMHLEKMNALKRKFMQALTYPALVISVAFAAVGFLLLFIVPSFAEMFKSFQLELPWSTQMVLGVSETLNAYGLYGFLVLFGGLVLLNGRMKRPETRQRLESSLFRWPFLGSILLKNHIVRFCRTLGTMLQANVSLVDALETSRRIIQNKDLKSEIGKITVQVRQGHSVAEPVLESRFFPPMVAQMITVGEETSELDKMLLKVAEYYEKEIDSKVETLSSLIEPVIVLFLGLLVAAILIAMYLPMFDLVGVVSGG